nr:hypothetical protein [uncultured bacterium]
MLRFLRQPVTATEPKGLPTQMTHRIISTILEMSSSILE